MAYNTTASLDKLTCTDYEEFGECQNRFGRFSRSKKDSNYLDVKLKAFKKDDSKGFRLVQKFTVGVADFNQLLQLRNQLVIAPKNFARDENLSPVLIPTMSKDMDEQLKPAHKVTDVVERANEKIFVTLLQYSVNKSEVLVLKSEYLLGIKRLRRFNKFSMWNINLKNSSIFLI